MGTSGVGSFGYCKAGLGVLYWSYIMWEQLETAEMTYEEYLSKREIMVEENQNLVGNVLNLKEQAVDGRLRALKDELYEEIGENDLFKMKLMGDPRLWNSSLYAFIKALPKGSDLHVHATALLPAHRLIDFVLGRNDLVVDVRDGHIYNIDEPGYDRDQCHPLSRSLENGLVTREFIEKKWTMLGKAHNESVWDYFENLLGLFESIEYSEDTLFDYYVTAFEYYIENNIFHIEIHAVFSEDYERSLALAGVIKRAYFEVKRKHSELIVSIICSGLKYLGVEMSVPELYLKNAVRLREAILDDFDRDDVHPFIIGFDLLNEEDRSIPLKELAPMLLYYRDRYPDFDLYIHCGESLYAQVDNLIDAYLLGAARVGHGMNLYRFPKLLSAFADREICLEACPISNMTLRYVKDLRLHPVAEYLKRGVTVSLCSDDPVCQEHETLTDDFFAGTVCWDLNLSDIKQLCINSIMYSGLDKSQKSQMYSAWKKAWVRFTDSFAD